MAIKKDQNIKRGDIGLTIIAVCIVSGLCLKGAHALYSETIIPHTAIIHEHVLDVKTVVIPSA